MPVKRSAGLLVYRRRGELVEVFLVHPGGPYWQKKDDGAWSLPKGEYEEDEDALSGARREFLEETGIAIEGDFTPLRPVRQAGGKLVHAFAVPGDFDAAAIRSNTFSMQWPPRSGRMQSFPEVDRGGWFTLEVAAIKLLSGQRPLLDELRVLLTGIGA